MKRSFDSISLKLLMPRVAKDIKTVADCEELVDLEVQTVKGPDVEDQVAMALVSVLHL